MNFRRMILALAVLALFTGLASAQVSIGPGSGFPAGNLTCNANVAVPPQLRAEGMTELIGDIVISCTGGSSMATGQLIPTANITVSLGTNVTSRLLGNASTANASEALLMIDEPGSTVSAVFPGYGPQAAQTLCAFPTLGAGSGGCTQYVGANGQPSNCTTVGGTGNCTTLAATAPANIFQGVVSGNQVVFNGIPVDPPVTGGSARVFRITNVRANAAALGGGSLAGTTQLLASISISGSTSLPVNNAVVIAGFIQSGLTTSLRNATNTGGGGGSTLSQCGGGGPNSLAMVQFTENFATATKTRVAATSSYNGQGGNNTIGNNAIQNVPGAIYNSESGFILAAANGNGAISGLADYGTRLKAVFTNVPSGVSIFVSTTSLTNTSSATQIQPAGTSTTSFAQLVLNETAPDVNGIVPAATATTSANTAATGLWQVPIVNGTGMAVWEVVNTNPSGPDTFAFGVWQSFTANPGSNSPPPGTGTVNLSYAPTPTAAFTAAAGSAASGSLSIPRFADTSSAGNLFSIVVCQTSLLYPFITNQTGFDTGIAIANTSTDPFGTRVQNGACTLNWYGGANNPAATNTGNIATGTVYTTLASTSAAGFQGYMIAVCNFQLAHGFAFISDIGARNLAMGYLAEVLGTGSRNNINEQLMH